MQAATSAVISTVAAQYPGIKIFATGKWREVGLGALRCDGVCDVSLLSQEDEGKFAGMCTASQSHVRAPHPFQHGVHGNDNMARLGFQGVSKQRQQA